MSLLFEMSCHLKADDQSGDKYSDWDCLLAESDFETIINYRETHGYDWL